jgi:hypothetical protein
MGTKGESRKARLTAYLNEIQAERIDETVWQELLKRLTPVSESYLRKLVRATGTPMTPMVEGVVQDSFDSVALTLTALETEYERSEAERRRAVRKLVITAKDHATFALKRMAPGDERRQMKEEMLLWMRTWLENPTVFSSWLALRRGQGGLGPS